MPLNTDEALIQRLNQILALCEAVGLPFKTVNLDDPVCQKGYLIVLKANRITASILNEATPQIIGMDRFPTPGHIVEKCLPYREVAESNRMRGWIVAVDPRPGGNEIAAPPHLVLDGVYVPEGGGNGRPAPAVPELPMRPEEMEKIRERIEKLKSPLALTGPTKGAATGVHVPAEAIPDMERDARQYADWAKANPEEARKKQQGGG